MCGVQGSRDRRDTAARSRAPEEEGVLVRVLWAGRYGRGAVDRSDALAAEVLVRALLARVLVLLCVAQMAQEDAGGADGAGGRRWRRWRRRTQVTQVMQTGDADT